MGWVGVKVHLSILKLKFSVIDYISRRPAMQLIDEKKKSPQNLFPLALQNIHSSKKSLFHELAGKPY